jgi:hypothetical protein
MMPPRDRRTPGQLHPHLSVADSPTLWRPEMARGKTVMVELPCSEVNDFLTRVRPAGAGTT